MGSNFLPVGRQWRNAPDALIVDVDVHEEYEYGDQYLYPTIRHIAHTHCHTFTMNPVITISFTSHPPA